MTIGEVVIRAPDGLGLFLRDFAPQAPVTGEPVLCLHGLTRNSRDFERVAPRIAALGRRTLALDFRGRGKSDWDPVIARYHAGTYARDALAALDQLGVKRAVWLGTSLGGVTTMVAAGMAPSRIGGAILNDVGPVLAPEGLARIAGYVGRVSPLPNWSEAAAAVAATQGAAFPGRDQGFWEEFARRTHRQRPDGLIEADYDPAIGAAMSVAPPVDLPAAYAALKPIPALLLRGALSDLLTRDGVAQMRQAKPDLAIAEVPNVGHAPTLEEPSAFLPLIDFLARLP